MLSWLNNCRCSEFWIVLITLGSRSSIYTRDWISWQCNWSFGSLPVPAERIYVRLLDKRRRLSYLCNQVLSPRSSHQERCRARHKAVIKCSTTRTLQVAYNTYLFPELCTYLVPALPGLQRDDLSAMWFQKTRQERVKLTHLGILSGTRTGKDDWNSKGCVIRRQCRQRFFRDSRVSLQT